MQALIHFADLSTTTAPRFVLKKSLCGNKKISLATRAFFRHNARTTTWGRACVPSLQQVFLCLSHQNSRSPRPPLLALCADLRLSAAHPRRASTNTISPSPTNHERHDDTDPAAHGNHERHPRTPRTTTPRAHFTQSHRIHARRTTRLFSNRQMILLLLCHF